MFENYLLISKITPQTLDQYWSTLVFSKLRSKTFKLAQLLLRFVLMSNQGQKMYFICSSAVFELAKTQTKIDQGFECIYVISEDDNGSYFKIIPNNFSVPYILS